MSTPAATHVSDLSGKALRGGGTTLVAQGFRLLLQFGSVLVLARLLAPADFGLVAMVTSVIGVAELVRDLGLSNAAVRAPTLSRHEQTNLFWANTGIGLSCSVIAAASAPLVSILYGEPELVAIVLAVAGVFTLNGAAAQFRVGLTRDLRFGRLAVTDIGGQAAGVAVAIGAAVAGAGLWALVAQQLTNAVVALVLAVGFSPFRPGWVRRDVSIRGFVGFGGRLLGTSGLWWATKNLDNVILGVVAGPVALGVYARAYQLLMTPLNQLNAPMTRVALPVLSAVHDERDRFSRYVGTAQLVGCYVTAPVLAVAAALCSPLVAVLLGPDWAAVAPVFAALAVGGIFRAVSQLAFWIYVAQGRPGQQFRMLAVVAPVMVLLMLLGSTWGAVGVAGGHSVGHLVYWAVSLWHVGRVTGVPTRPLLRTAGRSMVLVSLPMALAAAAANLLPVAPVLQLLAGVGGALAYLALGCAVLPWLRRDLSRVLSLVRRAAGRRR